MKVNPTKILYALNDFVRAQPRPVLVHQMSKVGSTTVCKTLLAAGIRPWHLHHVSRMSWESTRDAYFARGQYDLPHHFYLDWLARNYLKLTSHRLKVVSLVRDPIARVVSSIFQSPKLHGFDISEEDVDRLSDKINKYIDGYFSYEYNWFNREFEKVYDIDVFEYSFNREQGFGIYNNDRFDIIIMTTENLSKNIESKLSKFLEVNLKACKGNIGEKKKIGNKYSIVKNKINFEKDECRMLYDDPWMRYFYTDAQTRRFIDRWSAPGKP